jgi:hypothetical protein
MTAWHEGEFVDFAWSPHFSVPHQDMVPEPTRTHTPIIMLTFGHEDLMKI